MMTKLNKLMLHDGATEKDKIKLLKEAAIIEQFAHNNIVKLRGAVMSQHSVSVCHVHCPLWLHGPKFLVSQLHVMVFYSKQCTMSCISATTVLQSTGLNCCFHFIDNVCARVPS